MVSARGGENRNIYKYIISFEKCKGVTAEKLAQDSNCVEIFILDLTNIEKCGILRMESV